MPFHSPHLFSISMLPCLSQSYLSQNLNLIPLAAVNFGIQKAKEYFTQKFSIEFSDVISDIPEEHLIDPKPSIAGPALQGLAFSIDENELKNLYLQLLKTAVDGRVFEKAHPSFVEVIKQISNLEAINLMRLLRKPNNYPIIRFKFGRLSPLHT